MSGMSIILMIPVSGGESAPASPSYSVSGPSGGVALAESTNFTVTAANLTGPVVVTPASDDPGGTFDPATVTIDVGDLVKTFTYTPDGSVGPHNLTWSNNGGLSDPAGIAYEVTAVPDPGLTDEELAVASNGSYGTDNYRRAIIDVLSPGFHADQLAGADIVYSGPYTATYGAIFN